METREGQFIEKDGVQIWLEKMDCLLEITSTLISSEHWYLTLARAVLDKRFITFLK